MVGAAVLYALVRLRGQGRYKGLTSVQTSFISLSVAAVLTLPSPRSPRAGDAPGLRAALAVLALGVVGTALAFVIFYKLIAEVGAGRASLVCYLAPGVALFYGARLPRRGDHGRRDRGPRADPRRRRARARRVPEARAGTVRGPWT